MRMAIVIAVFIIALACSSHGAVWNVPSPQCPTIQSGIDLAAVGDSVLVQPGEYSENLIMKSGVALIGDGGWAVTTINRESTGQPIITCVGMAEGTLISGFSIEDGVHSLGAGIYCEDSSVRITENRFAGNYSNINGAGLACLGSGNTEITCNDFSVNEAEDWGGGIYCSGSSPLIDGNTFSRCLATYGGAIACVYDAAPHILGNSFTNNTVVKQGAAVHVNYGATAVIESNVIAANHAFGGGGAVVCMRSTLCEFRGNLVYDNSATDCAGIAVAVDAHVICDGNTFYANSAPHTSTTISCTDGSHMEITNCIIAGGTGEPLAELPAVNCWNGGTAVLDCNDFWANATDYSGCSAGPNDFYEDPLFCDAESGDFTLEDCSPCLDGYGCGQVGAYGVGCECTTTATVPTTWGAIKSMYR